MERFTPQQIARLFRILAWAFGVTGALFLVFPDATIRSANGLGSMLGSFPPLPASSLRFWVALAVAYMALVTALAATTATDVVRYRPLMPILAGGKCVSALAGLYYYLVREPAFLYLATFLVDGTLALLVLAAYRAVAALPVPAGGALGAKDDAGKDRDREILEAVLATMLAGHHPSTDSAAGCDLAREVRRYFARVHPRRGPTALRALLWVVELGPLLFFGRRRCFTQLEHDAQEEYLSGFERSRFGWRRQVLASLKLITMLHFYEHPAAAAAVGYEGSYLRERLLAGPNAPYHGERLEREAAAAKGGKS